MKQFLIRRVLSILLVILCSSTLLFSVKAATLSDTQKEKASEIALSVLPAESDRRTIKCFDVRDDGWFAIGYRQNEVHVYNASGEFVYGYRFQCDGDYGIAFDNSFLTIYLVRGDTITAYDDRGNCVYTKKALFSTSVLDKIIYKTDKQVGITTYILERDIGFFQGDYSRLVAIDQYGTRTVLYDVTTRGYFIGACHYLLLILLAAGFVFGVYSSVKRALEKNAD